MKALIEKRAAILIGLVLTVGIMAIEISNTPLLERYLDRIDNILYDFRMQVLLPPKALLSDKIVIVDLDEKSLLEHGQWPWSRKIVAHLVEEMALAGVKVAAFDVVFAEPEQNAADSLIEDLALRGMLAPAREKMLQEVSPSVSNDKYLSSYLRKTDVVLGYVFHDDEEIKAGKLGYPITRLRGDMSSRLTAVVRDGYSAALDILQRNAKDSGFINVLPDSDGLIRRAPLILQHDDGLYPSLALAAVMYYTDTRRIRPMYQDIGELVSFQGVQLGDRYIATDGIGRMSLGFKGGAKSYQYVSAADVISGMYRNGGLKDKLAFVGTTVLGLSDVRAIPLSQSYPGVEVHATVADNIINQDMPYKPSWEPGVLLVLLAALGFLVSLVQPFLRPLWLVTSALVALAFVMLSNFYLWQVYRFDLTMVTPWLLIILLSLWNGVSTLLKENTQRLAITAMFGQYVPAEHVNAMLNDPERYSMDGDNRLMSVMFADIRGFTNMSEKLTAQELKMVLNRFFTPITRVIFENQGTIDKYVGDMVMAFWGAPLEDAGHSSHAIMAGFAMHEEIRKLKLEFAAEGLPEIDMGIGINTGNMNVGDMGSEYRRAYTVLGDAVNLGSRVESLTKFYGSLFLVTESTKLAAPEYIYRQVDNIRVKGKLEPVKIFEPLCLAQQASADLLSGVERYSQALELYGSQRWDQAETLFTQLQSNSAHQNPHLPGIYLQRIAELRHQDLGSDWDGVYIHTSK